LTNFNLIGKTAYSQQAILRLINSAPATKMLQKGDLRMSKLRIPIILFLIGLLLTACGGSSPISTSSDPGDETYTNISVAELSEMFEDKDFQLINVHVPFEGDLPSTDTSIPYDQIDQNLALLPENRDAKFVVYCRSGSMSSIAAQELVSLGYTNVLNLEGGFNAWKAEGFPME
jgi:rhodanese-related sulfurtransferase